MPLEAKPSHSRIIAQGWHGAANCSNRVEMGVLRRCLQLFALIPLLAACATVPPAPPAASQRGAKTEPAAKFELAPMPFVHYRPSDSTLGVLEIPIPPKMPPGTGAVPVSGSPFRGSIVTGFHEAF